MLYSKMGRILSISWGNGDQNYVCRHPVWHLFQVSFKFSILHYSSCFKLIPMILTLQCHLFDHIFCNGKSTLYSKMGRILSISWGNAAQNYVCRHPLRQLWRVFSSFSILHILSCFKLIPMILTLQCHLFDHMFCNGNSTLYSKMGRILSISWENAAQNSVLGTASFFFSPQSANPQPNFIFLNPQPQIRNWTFKSLVRNRKSATTFQDS